MQVMKAIFLNNQTFIWTLDFTQIAAAYAPIASAVVRVQVKNFSSDASAIYEWATGGAIQGVVVYSTLSKTAQMTAPQAGVSGILGLKYFDVRVETSDGEWVVACGTIDFQSGVTKAPVSTGNTAFGQNLNDTVIVQQSYTVDDVGIAQLGMGAITSAVAAFDAHVTSVLDTLAASISMCLRTPDNSTIPALPSVAVRYNSYLAFDGAGNPYCVSMSPSTYNAHVDVSFADYSALDNGTTDNITPLANFKASNPVAILRLPHVINGIYKFSTIPDFSGLQVQPDDPTITIFSGAGNLAASMRLTRPLTMKFLSASSVPYYDRLDPAASAPSAQFRSYLAAGDYDKTTRRSLNCTTDLEYMSRPWPSDSSSAVSPAGSGTNYVSWSFTADANFHYARPKAGLRAGEELVCYWQETGNYLRSILIETSGGLHVITENGSGGAISYQKITGSSATNFSIDWTGHASHNSYKFDFAEVGIRIINQNTFSIAVNGVVVLGPVTALGAIENAGFGVYSPSGSYAVSIVGWNIRKGGLNAGVLPFTLGVIGDSRSYDHYGAWPYYARQNLEFYRGIRCIGIDNRAVAGEASGSQLTRLQSVGVGSTTVWVVSLCTNDIQAGTAIGAVGSAGTVLDNMSQIFTILKNADCKILFVHPFLWYGQSNVLAATGQSGFGQASAGYDAGSPYYAAIERLCNTMSIPVLDGREVYGQIIAELLSYDPQKFDPTLMDDIHPTCRANEVMGRAVARSLATVLTPEPSLEMARMDLPSAYFANSWTSQSSPNNCSGARSKAGVVTLSGVANAGTVTAGTVIYTLPPYFRPAARRDIVAIASTGAVRLQIDTNGQISVPAAITGAAWLSIACSYSID